MPEKTLLKGSAHLIRSGLQTARYRLMGIFFKIYTYPNLDQTVALLLPDSESSRTEKKG